MFWAFTSSLHPLLPFPKVLPEWKALDGDTGGPGPSSDSNLLRGLEMCRHIKRANIS